MRFSLRCSTLGLVAAVFVSGCGSSSTPLTEVDTNNPAVADRSDNAEGLPLLAVPGPDAKTSTKSGKVTQTAAKSAPSLLPKGLLGKKPAPKDNADETAASAPNGPEKGSPEWLLNEIQRVRLMPLPQEAAQSENEDEDEEDQPLTPAQEKKFAQEIEKTRTIRRERNFQIIKLAEECLQKTSQKPDQEPLFCAAVHNLLDARLQLALQGDASSIDSLYEAEKVFYERNPKSDSASEACLTLVNLTHANAVRYGTKDPRWLKEFSKRAQIYANRFPEEGPRSVPLLMAAGRSCENNGQPEEAKTCYGLLATKFKETAQGQQAEGILRRMQLKGHELDLSGPGIDGNDIVLKSMRGKMVLIVFWSSTAQPFIQQLPKILEVTAKYKKYCTVVGVNIDTDEKAVEAFVEANHLDWQQVFFPSKSQRGWNSPVAAYYGVNMLPTLWLVDPNGIVAETNLDASNLEAKLREVYTPFLKKK